MVLFPSVDVCSAYPLVIHTITNNIYLTLFGRDTSKKSKTPKLDFGLQILIKFITAVLPIAAAMLISNLVYVLKYAGLMGFFIAFFFPTALQLSSTWKCSKVFGTRAGSGVDSPLLREGAKACQLQNGSELSYRNLSPSSQSKLSQMCASYQTPYSNRLLSHPITVIVLGVSGLVLFLLAISSLTVHPNQLHCNSKL